MHHIHLSSENVRRAMSACAALVMLMLSAIAHAQGGPPLVTDDPDTPGDNHWEINIASIVSHDHQGLTRLSAPDMDINYGWGDRIQLKLDLPISLSHDSDAGWAMGVGSTEFGIKWRFIDGGEDGWSVSTYPQYITGWTHATLRHALADNLHEYFLPVEASKSFGSFKIDGELGRDFVPNGESVWMTGIVLAHDVLEGTEGLFEIHETIGPSGTATLLNLGLHHEFSKDLGLITAVGHEFGPALTNPRGLLVYLGVQVKR
jgi:hypothetical protein